VPRCRPFEALQQQLAGDSAVRIAEINGSPEVALTFRAPEGTTLPAALRVIAQYRAVPDAPRAASRQRLLAVVPSVELLAVLRDLRAAREVTPDHVYDF
jgi:hypothetical protein